MERIICPGCKRSVEPIKIFDRSPKTKKPYLIIRCPFDRCKFNIDIEDYVPKPPNPEGPKNADRWRGNFWTDFA